MKQERSDSDKKDSANVELRNENLCPFISPLKQKSTTGDKQQISKSVIFKCLSGSLSRWCRKKKDIDIPLQIVPATAITSKIANLP